MGLRYSLRGSGVIPVHSASLVHTQQEDKRGKQYQAWVSQVSPKRVRTETLSDCATLLG